MPSKILEEEVNNTIVKHVFEENQLMTDRQWAYRRGYSTELLLAHLTETWRKAVDSGLKVAVAFIDFKKAFDSVSHPILEHKLQNDFAIGGSLLTWLKSYLRDRTQYTVVNGKESSIAKITYGIPQGSVLGPTLFALFTNDLPENVESGNVYMYADDTTLYRIGDSADEVVSTLNKALSELYEWCIANQLTPHPQKSEVMLLSRQRIIGPLAPVFLGDQTIKWVKKTKLLGMVIDENLSWNEHISELKLTYVNKLNLVKTSRFLPTSVLLDLYFKVILPSITYALVVWGGCSNKENFKSLERLHCRAARIIYKLPRYMPLEDVLSKVGWNTLFFYYKTAILKLICKIIKNVTPNSMSDLVSRRECNYSLRAKYQLSAPRFNTKTLKLSITYRGAILWNDINRKHSEINIDEHDSVNAFVRKVIKTIMITFKDFVFL